MKLQVTLFLFLLIQNVNSQTIAKTPLGQSTNKKFFHLTQFDTLISFNNKIDTISKDVLLLKKKKIKVYTSKEAFSKALNEMTNAMIKKYEPWKNKDIMKKLLIKTF